MAHDSSVDNQHLHVDIEEENGKMKGWKSWDGSRYTWIISVYDA